MSSTGTSSTTHPYVFTMRLALATMLMYFAALTSAYIVKRAQVGWVIIEIPIMFWVSAGLIVLSSFTMHLAKRKALIGHFWATHQLTMLTLLLGLGFLSAQLSGFRYLMENGVHLEGNVAGAFMYLIAWSHLIHIIAGIVVLSVIYIQQYRLRKPLLISMRVVSVFWHFLDLMWLYLLALLFFFR